MNIKRERLHIVIAGLIIGVIASLLVFFGNPANMGFCIACFLRAFLHRRIISGRWRNKGKMRNKKQTT